MAEQLTFDLPGEPALGRGDFFVSPGNEAAVQAIQGWHDWPGGKLVLAGPRGAGKTHLVHVWAAMCGARIVAAHDLADADVAALAGAMVAVEDADRIAGNGAAEQALFHLHNLVLAEGGGLLITAASPPLRWGLSLPDLQSRMQGSALVTLAAPDDTLLAAVLVKLFTDRQIAVDAGVVTYLTGRMERSFAGAGRVVEALDRAALAKKRRITRPLAARVLDKLGEAGH
ncbi:MAG: chromosomal replication initiator DnaA [Rhodobacteraceae bacterium]|nr:chromosomal replication initiator DnaA [Paracoccaceae bacterium]